MCSSVNARKNLYVLAHQSTAVPSRNCTARYSQPECLGLLRLQNEGFLCIVTLRFRQDDLSNTLADLPVHWMPCIVAWQQVEIGPNLTTKKSLGLSVLENLYWQVLEMNPVQYTYECIHINSGESTGGFSLLPLLAHSFCYATVRRWLGVRGAAGLG